MKKRYEALLALDTRGKEETAKEIIERLEKEFATEGAVIEQVQRLEKRELSYEHDKLASAYFVNFIFEANPGLIAKLRAKFTLDADVSMQNYLHLPLRKKRPESKAKAKA